MTVTVQQQTHSQFLSSNVSSNKIMDSPHYAMSKGYEYLLGHNVLNITNILQIKL